MKLKLRTRMNVLKKSFVTFLLMFGVLFAFSLNSYSQVTTYPYTQDFATYIPTNWNEGTGGDNATGPTTVSTTAAVGWLADGWANSGSSGAAKNNIYTTGGNEWLLSETFAIPAASTFELLYDVGAFQWNSSTALTTAWETDDTVWVLVKEASATAWTVLTTYNASNYPTPSTTETFDLTAYAGQTIQFAFRMMEGTTNGSADIDFMIDNFIVRAVNTCEQPTTITVTDITSTGAVVHWVAPATAPALGYQILVNDGTTSTYYTSTVDSIDLAGLLGAVTSYNVSVRAICGVGDTSYWEGPVSFVTLCGVVVAPYYESLDPTTMPACYTNTNSTSTNANTFWKFTGTPGYGATANGRASGSYAWVDASTTNVGIHDVTLTTMQINIAGLTNPMLQFDWFKNNSNLSYDNNSLTVEINDGTGWTTLMPADTSNEPCWRTKQFLIPTGLASDTVSFRFVVDKNTGSNPSFYDDMILDEIRVENAPAPPVCADTALMFPSHDTSFCESTTGTTLTWPAVTDAVEYTVFFSSGASAVDSITTKSCDLTYTTSALAPGTYAWKVVPKNAGGSATGCFDMNITVIAAPTVVVAPTSATICLGDTANLVASGADEYLWTPTASLDTDTGSTVNAFPTATTTYTVTGTENVAGCTNTATATVNVNPLPAIDSLSATSDSVCLGNSTLLSSYPLPSMGATSYCTANSTATTYTDNIANVTFGTIDNNSANYPAGGFINNPSANQNYTDYTSITPAVVTAGSANTISVTQYNTNGSYTTYVNAFVDWNQDGDFDDANETFNIGSCAADGVARTATINVPLDAFDGDTRLRVVLREGGSATSPSCGTYSYGEVEDYTITVTGGFAGYNMTWSDGTSILGTSDTLTVSPTATTTYTFVKTNPVTGCSDSLTKTITVNPLPTVTATMSPTSGVSCFGAPVDITASGAVSYAWTPSTDLSADTGAMVTSTPTASTVYTVTGTDANGCMNTATASVTLDTFTITATAAPDTLCLGDLSDLMVTNTLATLTGPTTLPTGYCTPVAESAYGDYVNDFTFNTISNLGTTNSISSANSGYVDYSASMSTDVNVGDTYNLMVQGSSSYTNGKAVWIDYNRDGDFDDAGEFVASAPTGLSALNTTVTIPASATLGATKMRVLSVYNTSPTSTSSSCTAANWGEYEDYAVNIMSEPGTYTWTASPDLSATSGSTVTATPTTVGVNTYEAVFTSSNGCSDTITVDVFVNGLPTLAITPATATICEGDTANLVASGASTYTWTPAASLDVDTGSTVNAFPTANTTYNVIGTDAATGCESSATANVIVNDAPIISSITTTSPHCAGVDDTMIVVLGADVSKYSFAASTGATLVDTTGATTIVASGVDDNISAPVALPFTFNFNGVDYSYFGVSPDGFVGFNNDGSSFINDYSNSVTAPVNLPTLYPYWDDLATGSNGNVSYIVTGTAPNRVLVIDWFVTAPRATSGTAATNFQAWLHEGTNQIDFVYGPGGTSTSASIGLTGSSTEYLCLDASLLPSTTSAYNSHTTIPTSGTMYSFTLPTYTYEWSDGTTVVGTDDTLVMASSATTTYYVSVTNAAGCSTTDSIESVINPTVSLTATPTPSDVCATPNGAIALTSAEFTNGDVYDVYYNGVNQGSYTVTSDSINITGLSAGDYTDVYVVNASMCNSDTVTPVTISDAYGSSAPVTPSTNTDTATQTSGSEVSYYDASCNIIATVEAASGNLGGVSSEAVVEGSAGMYNGMPYVMRHHEITVDSSVGGVVTLYYLDSEFTNYNANNATYPDFDATASNLMITAFHSLAGSGGAGPNGHDSALSTVELITPSSIVWNATASRWEVTFTTSGFSGFYAHTTPSPPLPIKLGDIAARNNGDENIVTWYTLSEDEGESFELQRSVDGRSFEKLATLPTKGEASEYTYYDVNPYTGVNYYRLLILQNDGNAYYSKVVHATVNKNGNFGISAYPNPTAHDVTVEISGQIGANAQIIVTDVTGKIVSTINEIQSNKVTIELGQLPDGVYLLKYIDNDHTQSIKITKK